jgi:hypothetical protein
VKDYETKFDKDGGNLDQFIQQQFSERTKGLGDKSFLTGYSASFGQAMEHLRAAHSKFQTQQVVENHESNLLFQIDSTVRADVTAGRPIDPAKLDALKGEFKKFFGTSGADWNDLLFKSVKRLGDDGNPTVYAFLKEKNADGTPGMYYIPKWKTQVDAAEVHAQNVFLEKQTRAYTLAQKQREEKQDTALYSVFDKLYNGDTDGAQTDFAAQVKSGLFTRASDIVKWQEMFRKVETRELRPDEQAQMSEALAGVVTGKMGVRDILALELPPKEKRQLLSEWRNVQNQERQLEAQGATDENRPFRMHSFKEQEDWLEGQSPSAAGLARHVHEAQRLHQRFARIGQAGAGGVRSGQWPEGHPQSRHRHRRPAAEAHRRLRRAATRLDGEEPALQLADGRASCVRQRSALSARPRTAPRILREPQNPTETRSEAEWQEVTT